MATALVELLAERLRLEDLSLPPPRHHSNQ